jgi:hypothetical protein
MQDPPACQALRTDRHERAGGGQAQTGIQYLLHKGITLSYQCFLPQNSNKTQFMNNILEWTGKG